MQKPHIDQRITEVLNHIERLPGQQVKKHIDKKDTVGNEIKYRKGGGQDWKVVKSGYVRTGGPNLPFITGDIDEDEIENTVSYNGKTVPFCPRGWVIDPTGSFVLVPTALALFSYLEALGDADVITYDEAENTGVI